MTRREREKYIERWRNVIRVMEQVEANKDLKDEEGTLLKRFSLHVWYRKEEGCGTVACALGWCALDGWFQRRGLRVDDERGVVLRTTSWTFADFQAITEFFDPKFPGSRYESPEPFEVTRIFCQSPEYEQRFGRGEVCPEQVIALVREYVQTTFDVEI